MDDSHIKEIDPDSQSEIDRRDVMHQSIGNYEIDNDATDSDTESDIDPYHFEMMLRSFDRDYPDNELFEEDATSTPLNQQSSIPPPSNIPFPIPTLLNLALLINVLPDPNQQLAVQVTLDAFTISPDLPLELRRKIWQCTFPGPRNFAFSLRSSRKSSPRTFKKFHAPPIASRVNHESRTEFLLQYTPIIQFSRIGGTGQGQGQLPLAYSRKASFFNFDRDWVHFDLFAFIMHLYPHLVSRKATSLLPATLAPQQQNSIFTQLTSTYPRVQRIELRCFLGRYGSWTTWTMEQIVDALAKGKLSCFKRVKEIRLVRDLSVDRTSGVAEEKEKERVYGLIVQACRRYLGKENGEKASNFVMPVVEFCTRDRY
ncbi:hypothetical protein B0J14DRAFT_678028 [Halenospora varia]|nr:hypothetical protein B0J14DRAFT_678028 [Halenospora varia]